MKIAGASATYPIREGSGGETTSRPARWLTADGPKLTHQFFSRIGFHDTSDVSAGGK